MNVVLSYNISSQSIRQTKQQEQSSATTQGEPKKEKQPRLLKRSPILQGIIAIRTQQRIK
jgi:hypothetical protein